MNAKKSKKKNKIVRVNRGANGRQSLFNVPMPGHYNPTFTMVHKYRFRYTPASGAAASYLITPAKLCSLWTIATSTTQVTQIFESVRILKVKMWGTPPQNGTTTSCSINFAGGTLGFQGPNKKISADTMGMSSPAYISLTPDKDSYPDLWQIGDVSISTTQYFTIYIDPNGVSNQTYIIDITCALRQTTDGRTSGNNIAITGPAVVGGFYYLALDNNAGATGSTSSVWKPDPASLPFIS